VQFAHPTLRRYESSWYFTETTEYVARWAVISSSAVRLPLHESAKFRTQKSGDALELEKSPRNDSLFPIISRLASLTRNAGLDATSGTEFGTHGRATVTVNV
jgi:hypothetical protein